MIYTTEELKEIFQKQFNMETWYKILRDLFHASSLRTTPEPLIKSTDKEQGSFLGHIDTVDNYNIGLFYYRIQQESISHKRVGLRQLVNSFISPNIGLYDAALVIFESDKDWRLSFISDIKGDSTAPKRYTFIFGHKDNWYKTPVGRFIALQNSEISYRTIKDAFSVEALTKQFYNELFEWYLWAVSENSGITFPNNTSIEEDDREDIDIKIIRLITRIMFVWFIKQKELVPDKLFNIDYLNTILKDFDPQSTQSGNYYNAILQNLFFATLNRAINDENGKRRFAHATKKDIKTLYRYSEMFKISDDDEANEEGIVDIFSEVPFLNGGLFECLDKTKTIDGVEHAYNYDGFSRNEAKFTDGRYKNRACIPNQLFFKPEKGLFSIFNRYNFTIEENTPNEQLVALDPELLGKVFENLLGAYNPETKETARNESGSFYTPREVVIFMVDESLKAYLGKSQTVESLFSDNFIKDNNKENEYQQIANKLRHIKVLDPACGSGAYPMGLLNRMVEILQKINPTESDYDLKLSIIENCIYGSDIQSIAAQITKLRFFISLICECDKDMNKENYGIPTLPNLETKFVSANTLIAKKKVQSHNLFENSEIEPTKKQLAEVRHEHFHAKTFSAKVRLRKEDQELREKLANMLDDFSPADARQLAAWNPYDQNAVCDFFDPEWMFNIKDGFDVIIGNPPYVQLQNNGGTLAKLYEECGYKTFARTGDIYCLFYERGWQLLKQGGHLCYITSNKWMRAGYGEKTRNFLATKTNPMLLVDFSGVKIFESATVDTNILLFGKENNTFKTVCAVTNKQNISSVKNLSYFVEQHHSICKFSNSNSWIILSPIEQSIKRKIEAVGTPLKDWDVKINYGIKTGLNDAFIITTEKRNEILANCRDGDERERTDKLIRPILRGRDIKKYSYNQANLWLINIHNGIKGKLPRIDINNYPEVKRWLDYGGIAYNGHIFYGYKQLVKRDDQGDTPYNLRNCAYMEDFDKPKITWARLMRISKSDINSFPRFAKVETGILVLDSLCFFSGMDTDVLCKLLNSTYAAYYFFRNIAILDNGGMQMRQQYVENIPFPINFKEMSSFDDNDIYKSFAFSNEEIDFINTFVEERKHEILCTVKSH